ncbi:Isoleucyl-tRNA synthetase [hydrothermal vent metagenome]|uniref:isoleucine--tRNA ligase n=1 Tax=hydrothermal vent metagenome TaxID=652676 RepID=A0A3B0TVX4_9ZZZZ
MSDTKQGAPERDYSATLYLPKTNFPMRAGLPKREPNWLKRWQDMDIFTLLRQQSANSEKFTLHDGPPYANGNIHIGHALNKVLKDMVTRSMQMLGYNSAYVPGWDCHGLPIEWKIEEQYRAKGKNKDEVEINEFRRQCREFAQKWVDVQREEFKRLGIVGDWDNPYTTMAYDAEATIAGELMKFSMSGQLYRGSKPVMWSVVERTALAEAEIEYHDVESDAIWVKFPVLAVNRSGPVISDLLFASVVIWTTTPWTIPANRAIAFSSKLSYGLYQVSAAENDFGPQPGEKLIFADALADECAAKAKLTFKRLLDVTGDELAAMICAHPLKGWRLTSPLMGEVAEHSEAGGGEPYDFRVPLLDGDHVTDEAGTGFVHSAPGHGADDFEIWMSNARDLEDRGIDTSIPFLVDDAGYYTKDVPGFGPDAPEGAARIIDDKGKKGDANKRVIAALIEKGNLFARGRIKHSYPHSWRSKKPIIFRNTPQWFVYMDKELGGVGLAPSSGAMRHLLPQGEKEERVSAAASVKKEGASSLPSPLGGEGAERSEAGEGGPQPDTLRIRALKAIDQTRFVPASRKNRLRAMIENRPDWVLSRQRAWGVPITVFVNKETGEILKDQTVNERILTAFKNEGADAWFAQGAKERFLAGVANAEQYEQVTDILDVWFDSGSTHAFVLENKKKWPYLKWPASLYLEGSDQHRGWFHSSLLESCGTRGRAPYEAVLTNGFTMDAKGRKMSKSIGNTVAPQDIVKQYGADILRLWTASVDYWDDQRLGDEAIKTNVETYRKLRNSFRWMLGNLAHYRDQDKVDFSLMPELEQVILSRLATLDGVVRQAYKDFDYKKVVSTLSNFMNLELSAFYFDIRKDALYCDPPSSTTRKASLTVLDELFNCLTTWLAPILVFTMEEIWLERFAGENSSVHLQLFPAIPSDWANPVLEEKWAKIRTVRKVITGALEVERKQKNIGSSLEAAPKVFVADEQLLAALEGQDMAEISITSDIEIINEQGPENAFSLDEVPGVRALFVRATGKRCARSWKYSSEVGSDPEFPDLSLRDAKAMRELQAMAGNKNDQEAAS